MIICSGSQKVIESMVPTVECSRQKLERRLPRKELCSCTPAATAGCASLSRIARPEPATTIASRLIFRCAFAPGPHGVRLQQALPVRPRDVVGVILLPKSFRSNRSCHVTILIYRLPVPGGAPTRRRRPTGGRLGGAPLRRSPPCQNSTRRARQHGLRPTAQPSGRNRPTD